VGRIDPYFAVPLQDRFRNGAEKAAFFATGERVVNWTLQCLEAAFGSRSRWRGASKKP
jgi:hypothetical protein